MTWQDEDPGGLNRYLSDLHKALRLRGMSNAAIVAGDKPDDPEQGVYRVSGGLPKRLLGMSARVCRLSGDADLIHSHFALHAFFPVVFGSGRRLPVVSSFQGPWAEEARIEGDRSEVRFHLRRMVESAVYRRSHTLVCLSPAFARLLVREYGIPPWRTQVIHPGVDLGLFRPRPVQECRSQLGLPDGFVAVTVRRLAERMGLDVLLQAWSLVPSGLLVVAGEGPAREALLREAAALGLGPDRVQLLGRVSEEMLPVLYSAADVSVVPTTHLEGFGLVVLESLAAGTPVVASDVGGLSEVLPKLQEDLLVPPGDPAALARRLRGALDESASLPDRDACRRAAEGFDWQLVSARFEALYGFAADDERGVRRRVVYLVSTSQPSGGELALLRTIDAAAATVHPHVILAESGPLCRLLDEADVSWELLPLGPAAHARRQERRTPGAGLRLAVQFGLHSLKLARRLRQLDPDLVHANSLKAGLYGGVAARLAGRRLVWHVRDRLTDDYLGPRFARAFRLAVRHLPHGVIANSISTLETLKTADGQPVTVVPSPVQLPAAFRRSQQTSELVFVSVGRLTQWKGQDVLLRAFAQADIPREQARLLVVGGALFGEEAYARSLRELSMELGIDDRVDFLGHRSDVWEILSGAHVLVHSSVIPEPHGNVVAEGLAAGLAVIASDGGGPRELIQDGSNGLLTPPGDVAQLAAAMRRVWSDPRLRDRLGTAATSTVEVLRADTVAKRLTEFYDRVLQGA